MVRGGMAKTPQDRRLRKNFCGRGAHRSGRSEGTNFLGGVEREERVTLVEENREKGNLQSVGRDLAREKKCEVFAEKFALGRLRFPGRGVGGGGKKK